MRGCPRCRFAPVVTITASDPVAVENATPADNAQFTVTRLVADPAALDVHFMISGSAELDADYMIEGAMPAPGTEPRWHVTIQPDLASATFSIVPLADGVPEIDSEEVLATLSSDGGYAVGSPSSDRAVIHEFTPPPPPSDVVVSIALAPGTPTSIEEDSEQILTYQISRTGSIDDELFVKFAPVIGDAYAEPIADYDLPPGTTSLRILPGESFGQIKVRSVADVAEEGDEPVTLEIQPDPSLYTIHPEAASATGMIIDNDGEDPPTTGGPGINVYHWSAQGSSEHEIIPEADEDAGGVRLFYNGNGSPMAMTKAVLIKDPGDTSDYRVTRSSSSINVWENEDRTGELLTGTTGSASNVLNFAGRQSKTVWVEWVDSTDDGPATLSLEARAAASGTSEGGAAAADPPIWAVKDKAQAVRTKKFIIGLAGHKQSADRPQDPREDEKGDVGKADDEAGITTIAAMLRSIRPTPYAVATFAEDPDNDDGIVHDIDPKFCGDGVHGRPADRTIPALPPGLLDTDHFEWGAYKLAVEAITAWHVNELGLYGYSHGGSSVSLLTRRLAATPNLPAYQVKFTAYIDAVRLPKKNELFPGSAGERSGSKHGNQDSPRDPTTGLAVKETEYDEEEYLFPLLTPYHVNIYQKNPQVAAEVNSDFANLTGGPVNNLWRHNAEDPNVPTHNLPATRKEVNINTFNDNAPPPPEVDSFFHSKSYKLDGVKNFDRTKFADYAIIDHNNDAAGSLSDERQGTQEERAIDDHPVVQAYVVYHLRTAFGEVNI